MNNPFREILSHPSWFGADKGSESFGDSRPLAERRNLQRKIGKTIFDRLSAHSLTTNDRRIRVDKIEDNSGSYSISVGVEDPTSFCEGGFFYRGHPILCLSINLMSEDYYPASLTKWIYSTEDDPRPGRECDAENLEALIAESEAIIDLYDSLHH